MKVTTPRYSRIRVARFAALMSLPLSAVTPAYSEAIFADAFEGPSLNLSGQSWRAETWSSVPGAPRLGLSSAGRSGEGSARFALFRNDEYVETSNRTELKKDTRPGDIAGMGNFGQTRWYRWNTFVPNDYIAEVESAGFEILGQIHRAPNAGVDWRSPPLSVSINQGRWALSNNRDAGDRTADAGVVEPGQWVEWIVRADWSAGPDGQLEIFRDGQSVWNVGGANVYGPSYSNNDMFLKVGVYKPTWRNTDNSFTVRSRTWKQTFLFDEVRVGDEKETLESMRTPGEPIATELFDFTTAEGRVGVGADARVVGVGLDRHLVNTGGESNVDARGNDWAGGEYAAYLRFDLSELTLPDVRDATLRLVFADDAPVTVDVFAVPDGFAGRDDGFGAPELGENAWLEGTGTFAAAGDPLWITGDNAPGFDEVNGSPDLQILEALGSFTLDGGLRPDSLVEFTSPALRDAVAADRDGALTLALFIRGQDGTTVRLRSKEFDPLLAPSLEVIATDALSLLAGDFSGDGRVDQADLDAVLNNWGQPAAFAAGNVDQGELDAVLNHWGQRATADAAAATPLPEPGLILLTPALAMLLQRRHNPRRVTGRSPA